LWSSHLSTESTYDEVRWWTNDLILDHRGTAPSLRLLLWNLHCKISSGWSWWSWCYNSGYTGQISFRINLFDSWDIVYCSSIDVPVFAWLYWLQIFPFAWSGASIGAWFARKTDRICAGYASHLARCRTSLLITDNESWFFLNISSGRM
jgi:hypothetical protein